MELHGHVRLCSVERIASPHSAELIALRLLDVIVKVVLFVSVLLLQWLFLILLSALLLLR
jgi:hypothetical protein